MSAVKKVSGSLLYFMLQSLAFLAYSGIAYSQNLKHADSVNIASGFSLKTNDENITCQKSSGTSYKASRSSSSSEITINAKTILEKMIAQIQSIQNLRYSLYATERVNGNYLTAKSDIKIIVSPRKTYLKNPLRKLEVLYAEGENDNNALVNPGRFPYFTLSLDPHKSIMRKGQHHTIDDLGFTSISKIISRSIPKDPKVFEKTFFYQGIVEWKGYQCYKIYNEFKDFNYVNHTCKKGETVRSISNKYNCGDYRILEKYTEIKIGEELKEGTIISVPNYYASKTILYIDIKTYLPLSIKIFDNEGLYEVYEFRNLLVNKPFAKDEFSRGFNEYDF